MKCPYLHVETNGKVCRQMVNQGLDGELEDFDLKHYCEGNPNHCFFFRFFYNQESVLEQPEENEPSKPIVSMGAVVLEKAPPLEESPSEKTDKPFKLKRFFNYAT
jgi:hypothetical protein